MKQFSLKQVVPPPFAMPLLRAECIETVIMDYSSKHLAKIQMWNARHSSVLKGRKLSSGEHTDEYMAWYSLNTILHVYKIRQDNTPRITASGTNART